MRSRVFVNSKCKNSVNNVMKSDCNNVCPTAVDDNTNKQQVGKPIVSPSTKFDENHSCGNNSIKPVRFDPSNYQVQPNTDAVGVKVCNCFEPLS